VQPRIFGKLVLNSYSEEFPKILEVEGAIQF
jgi:hypothetical protein